MATNLAIIYGRLAGDATLLGSLGGAGYSGILQGGIWDKPLKREPPGETIHAFAPDKGRTPRPAAVIQDDGDRPHAARDAIYGAYNQFVSISLYAQRSATGKTKIHQARNRIRTLLDHIESGWMFTTEEGPVAFMEYAGRTGVRDSENVIGAVLDVVQFRITSRTGNLI